jgi:hypothetical protein
MTSPQPSPPVSPSPPLSDPAAAVGGRAVSDGLSGRWKLVMGAMTWTVQLGPRPGLPGEYIGMGEREAPDENGRPVTMEIAAVVEQRNLRAWLGLSVVKCTGAFRPPRVTTGTCTEIGGTPAGPFRAERLGDGMPPR